MKCFADKTIVRTIAAVVAGAALSFVLTPSHKAYPGAEFENNLREAFKWSGRGDWQRTRRFTTDAIAVMRQVENSDPFWNQSARQHSLAKVHAQALAMAGWAEWHGPRKESSAVYFEKAIQSYVDASAHLGMAQIHIERSNPDLALNHLAAARRSKIDNFLVQQFTHSQALLEASRIQLDLDQPFDSCIFAARARLASPGNVATYIQLAKCLSRMNLLDSALDVLEMPRPSQDPGAIILRAELHARASRYSDALKTLNKLFPERQLSAYSISDLPILKARGSIETARKHFKSAQRWFETALQIAPFDTDLRLNAAWAMNKQRKFYESSDYFETVLEAEPTNPSALLGLGEAYFEMGRIMESQYFLERILSHPPGSAEARKHFVGWAHFWIGRIFEARGEISAAIASFEAALRLNPVNIPARVHIANLIHKWDSCKAAIPHWIEIRFIQGGRTSYQDLIHKCEEKT